MSPAAARTIAADLLKAEKKKDGEDGTEKAPPVFAAPSAGWPVEILPGKRPPAPAELEVSPDSKEGSRMGYHEAAL